MVVVPTAAEVVVDVAIEVIVVDDEEDDEEGDEEEQAEPSRATAPRTTMAVNGARPTVPWRVPRVDVMTKNVANRCRREVTLRMLADAGWCQDGAMGSDGSKSRKKKSHLPKVPKYEVPNRAEGSDGGSFGRSGHGSDHHHYEQPTGFGAWVLKVLGRKPNP